MVGWPLSLHPSPPSPQVTAFTTSHTLSLSAIASAIAEEALVAVATVKAFGAEEEETKRWQCVMSCDVMMMS